MVLPDTGECTCPIMFRILDKFDEGNLTIIKRA